VSSLLAELVVSLTHPLTFSLWVAVAAVVVFLLGLRRLGVGVVVLAMAWSGLWSIPVASDWLRSLLERQHAVRDEATLPLSDAIVVLGGGGNYRWARQAYVDPDDLESSRLAAGARAWLAGRAPLIILSGGGEGTTSEAQVMARAIAKLGIPASALVLEEQSQNTADNARYTAELAERSGIGSVLLVTSSLHMPRAHMQFRRAGLEVVPVPVPELASRHAWTERWLPSRRALRRSARAFKEIAALVAVRVLG
jgi:uncharacterized SAM-binding protein YcdF (DUF218 family)